MCIKKVACGLQKVIKEDGRTVLEPIFVEVDCPEDMHRITSKIDSCKTVTPKVVEEKVQGDPVETSPYKFRFDKYSINWEKDKFQNQCTLISEENWANDVLSLQGYLFLNDVLDRLGIPRTKAGQIVGWVKNGEGDGYVSFGTFDCSKYEDIRYDENAFDLEFNCDGDILCKFN